MLICYEFWETSVNLTVYYLYVSDLRTVGRCHHGHDRMVVVVYNCLCTQCLSPLKLWVQIIVRCTRYCVINLSVTCDKVSGYVNQYNWPPGYSWNIVESGIEHHNPNSEVLIVFRSYSGSFHQYNFSSISINQSHRWMIRFNISKINGNWLLVLVELSGTIGGLFGGKEKEEEKIEETGEKPVEVGSVYL